MTLRKTKNLQQGLEFKSGIAEIIKLATCLDKDFFSWLEEYDLNNTEHLKSAILKSLYLKATVIKRDFKENNHRIVLNYGHTFAHVIESITHYSLFLHGEAVAIGMRMANLLAVKRGFLMIEDSLRIDALLKHYGLDFSYTIPDTQAFYEKLFFDKKIQKNKIRFIMPYGIGNFIVVDDIHKDVILDVIKEWDNN